MLGWGFYSLINLPSFIITQRLSLKYFLAAQASSVTGFLITAMFRSIFRKYGLLQKKLARIFVTVLCLSIIFSVFWFYADSLTSFWIHGREKIVKEESFFLQLYYMIWGTFNLFAWSVLYISMKLWKKNLDEQNKLEKANKLAIKAQLNALRYQLNPHFLFNSLSTLRGVISENPALAKQMIGKLSSFLQYTLSQSDLNEVPLKTEIEGVKSYLDIEKIRFGDSLIVKYLIDPMAEDYPFPAFILNPIVENAVKYGYDTSPGTLEIKILAEVKQDKSLSVIVENTGKWVERDKKSESSTGLSNVKKRLELMYHDYSFNIVKTDYSVIIKIGLKKEI